MTDDWNWKTSLAARLLGVCLIVAPKNTMDDMIKRVKARLNERAAK